MQTYTLFSNYAVKHTLILHQINVKLTFIFDSVLNINFKQLHISFLQKNSCILQIQCHKFIIFIKLFLFNFVLNVEREVKQPFLRKFDLPLNA